MYAEVRLVPGRGFQHLDFFLKIISKFYAGKIVKIFP